MALFHFCCSSHRRLHIYHLFIQPGLLFAFQWGVSVEVFFLLSSEFRMYSQLAAIIDRSSKGRININHKKVTRLTQIDTIIVSKAIYFKEF